MTRPDHVPPFPPEMETASYWEDVILLAFSEWLPLEMERGKIPVPVSYD